MKNKFKLLLIPMIISIILLSGCTEEIGQIIDNLTIKNSRPVGIISAPENGYFGESLVFDASNSYDLDGEILQYSWDFGDGNTSEGKLVEHCYEFENNYDIDYPLIFQVSLIVKDDNKSITGTNHQIQIFPSSYNFYIEAEKIIFSQPTLNNEKIKAGLSKIGPGNTLTYNLEQPINISLCKWKLNLHIKKPFLIHLKVISVTLYNKNNEEISRKDLNFKIFELWRDKVVDIEGNINEKVEFNSIKISVIGFTIFKRITIIYGGGEPSYLCFDFRK